MCGILSIVLQFITKAKKCISQSSNVTNTDLILSDAPIAEKNADTLNRKYFVENLKNVISAHPLDEQSVCICVDAKWGEGKTFVFNLLKEKLKEDREKINEIYKREYLPIILADKRLILNYMDECEAHSLLNY